MTERKNIEALVHESAPSSFNAGFGDRVASRLRTATELTISAALERQVRRIVPIVAAASLVLAAYNWWGSRDSGVSTIDAALNLPRVSLSSAYSTSTLIDASSIPMGTP